MLENDDGACSSSDAGASSDFSNGHCNRHLASSSDIADEDDEGDGIISLGKMKWFFELNEKQQTEDDSHKSARDIPIIVEDVSSDDDRDIRDIITGETKKQESVNASTVGIDSSFTFSLNTSQKDESS